jgi:DNA-binding transcriptional LysR family regulator
LAQGKLIHLVPEWHAAPLPIYLLYPYAHYYPAKLRRFVEIVRAALPQDIVPPPPDANQPSVAKLAITTR